MTLHTITQKSDFENTYRVSRHQQVYDKFNILANIFGLPPPPTWLKNFCALCKPNWEFFPYIFFNFHFDASPEEGLHSFDCCSAHFANATLNPYPLRSHSISVMALIMSRIASDSAIGKSSTSQEPFIVSI